MSDSGAGTARTFSEKWTRNPDLAFAQTLDERSEIARWILTRNGFESGKDLAAYLSDKRRILDAGCGNGRVTALLQRYAPDATEVVGVDLTAADVARQNLAGLSNVSVHEGDLLGDLSGLGEFDFIYCQEVLHHTADPEKGLVNLASQLAPGGEIAVYVYRRKAPVREFTDDYLRNRMTTLPYDEAMEVCRRIAELGRALSDLRATVRVPAIEPLEIEEGEYDIQRFVYHFFMKCFWNDELDPEANAAINYDWYHPEISSRHIAEEVREWFDAAGLEIVHEHVDQYGITMRGVRPGGPADHPAEP
jgi:SAM-dependent methyltransferase